MTFAQNLNQVILGAVCIALRRGDRCMAQNLLDHTDVHSVSQKQSSHRVAKHMRRDVPFDPGILAKLRNDVCNALRREAFGCCVQEQSAAFGSDLRPHFDMLPLYPQRLFVDYKGESIASALTLDAKDGFRPAEVVEVECRNLADAHAGRKE